MATAESILLNAATKYLDRTTGLVSQASSYTVMWWQKITAMNTSSTWHPVVAAVSDSDGDEATWAYLGASSWNVSAWLAGATAAYKQQDETGSPPWAWRHVAVVFSYSAPNWTVTCYIGGSAGTPLGPTTATRPTFNRLKIGGWPGTSQSDTFDAANATEVTAIKIWQAALSSGEIAAEIDFALPQKSGCIACVLGADGNDYTSTADFTPHGSVGAGASYPDIDWGEEESPDVTLALTGVGGTSGVGTLGRTTSLALTNNLGTSGLGSIVPGFALALSNVLGTGARGVLAPDTTVALSFTLGTGGIGNLTPALAFALSNVAATGDVSSLTPALSKELANVLATGSTGALDITTAVGLLNVLGLGELGNIIANLDADVTVSLSGVGGTGAIGDLTQSLALALTNNVGTGGVGTLSPTLTAALLNVVGLGAIGSLALPSEDVIVALSGVGGIGEAGDLVSNLVLPITGESGTGELGSFDLSNMLVLPLTGFKADAAIGALMPDGVPTYITVFIWKRVS